MGVATGCHDGKATPKIVEVKCPECGEILEVFVKGGEVSADETCDCGHIVAAGTPVDTMKRA